MLLLGLSVYIDTDEIPKVMYSVEPTMHPQKCTEVKYGNDFIFRYGSTICYLLVKKYDRVKVIVFEQSWKRCL